MNFQYLCNNLRKVSMKFNTIDYWQQTINNENIFII